MRGNCSGKSKVTKFDRVIFIEEDWLAREEIGRVPFSGLMSL